jgi:hypothetical protein
MRALISTRSSFASFNSSAVKVLFAIAALRHDRRPYGLRTLPFERPLDESF